ncbi:MAG TPA: thiamine pyrophosphate-binding protein [Rhizobiaceae bacterium]|nr:thiamine pyrophosphate-binding protein [Rhizobiaceae bacterium]
MKRLQAEPAGRAGMGEVEAPVGVAASAAGFGSDVVAQTLRDLAIPYIALNPGASFRGLHDSLVNFLGNQTPQMLLCLHEEHAVAIAHGYAKVTGQAMAAAVHSNVGLMHGTMAIFNAWCDRMPVLVIGATGPVDAAKRRPWIDWIHTARDQGALVRHYTKWDDQPASPAAAREALIRASWIAETMPMGPVYINLDAGMQEAPLEAPLPPLDAARHAPAIRPSAGPAELGRLRAMIEAARRPVILAGRVSRSETAWADRIELAERLGAAVLTDIKVGAAFPTDHPLHATPPANSPLPAARKLLAECDLLVSLDWVDLGGTLTAGGIGDGTRIVSISLDHRIHNGWSMDYQALPPVDLFLSADPDAVTADLLAELPAGKRAPWHRTAADGAEEGQPGDGKLYGSDLALALRDAVGERRFSLLHVPISWQGEWWHFRHPLDYVGSDSGGGIGGGPGIAVGGALALRGSGRLPIAICGDGDFIMGATAIWTAVRYRIPLLVVIANNASFYNDELHQERMAVMRGRPVENKWIGQKMIDPELDLAAMARAQGASGFGPVRKTEDLAAAYSAAIDIVEKGGVAVVDVRIEPGYPAATAGAVVHAVGERGTGTGG